MDTAPDDTTRDLTGLPALRSVVDRFGLMAKKNLGQNFLLDLNITAKVVRAAGTLAGKNVIEVGPGPGGLTRPLLESNCLHVTAVERDDRCIMALQELVESADGKLTLVADDALKCDYESLAPAPRAIVANLPYNIATVLLTQWLAQLHLFDSLTLMFQKEVADRITAETRTKDYGRLSVIAQWLCTAESKFDLPPSAFTPPPKVTSTVVHLRPRPRTDSVALETMEKLTAAAFGQRRKMLRQSLKSLNLAHYGLTVESFLEKAEITGTCRAEEIDIAGFVRMAQVLEESAKKSG